MQYKNSKSRSPSSSTFVECYKKQQVHYNDKLQMWLLFLLSWPEIWSIHNDKKCSPIMTFTVTSLIEVLAPLKDLFSLIEKKKKVWTKKKCKAEKKTRRFSHRWLHLDGIYFFGTRIFRRFFTCNGTLRILR